MGDFRPSFILAPCNHAFAIYLWFPRGCPDKLPPMLNFTDVAVRRGPRVLFSQLSLTIHQGQRVGVTGANGCGKSTLFALIREEIHSDVGEVSLPTGLVVAHVAQETPALTQPAIDYVLDGDQELRQVEADLARAEAEDNGERQALLHGRFDAIDGYSARARAARLLNGLGFTDAQFERAVSEFSGGWRMRLNLAQALMCRSDLLLLDEPTNHLDLDAVIWLQEWLRVYPGTLLLISHDRDFLDSVADTILHIEHQRATLYRGNYSAFERYRVEQLKQQQAAFEKQQREIAHVRGFVDRFKAKASKAKQAQSRIKTLERMELIAQAHVDTPFTFTFRPAEKLPRPLLKLEGVAIGYGDSALLKDVGLVLAPGDRVGLLGANGAGKSTLIKLLADSLPLMAGECTRAKDLRLGYFAQHQLEQLNAEATPLAHMLKLAPKESDQVLRNYLGSFGFSGERVDTEVGSFSGGEKARLVLAMLVYQRPNLLLLDEPTNHLDIDMRTALALALQDFDGAMVIVSHDRYMLDSVCDDFIHVADGHASVFKGDLDDYRQWRLEQARAERRAESGDKKEDSENSAAARKQQRQQAAEKRKQSQPLRKEVQRLEAQLDKLGAELAQVEQRLSDADIYQPEAKDELQQCLAQQAELKQSLQQVEEAWLSACETLESLEA